MSVRLRFEDFSDINTPMGFFAENVIYEKEFKKKGKAVKKAENEYGPIEWKNTGAGIGAYIPSKRVWVTIEKI